MKLKFKYQKYQEDAALSIIKCFNGQPKGERKDLLERAIIDKDLLSERLEEIYGFSNKKLEISYDNILKNIQEVQYENNLKVDEKLELLDGIINLSIEMETGTGKTYVYTKTIFELNKYYGWSKFIIMVPSIAIREGVYKSLQITEEHFFETYKKKIRYFIYDNKNKSNLINIKNFATTSSIEAIIMNYQAFNTKSKEARKIYQELDSMNSETPIDIIKRAKPILIIDEPQRFGERAEEKFIEFNPLFILRYSATHRKEYNKIYMLDTIDAYNQKLVKKINVKGIETVGSTATTGYVYFDRIQIGKDHYPYAYLEIDIKERNGIKRKIKKVKEGDNLYYISNELIQYKNMVVKEINGLDNSISFLNNLTLYVGQATGEIEEKDIRRIQIRETIRSHFEKEKELFQKGIKTLSLFFIDEVAKYRKYDESGNPIKGEYGEIFEQEYTNILYDYINDETIDKEYRKYLKNYTVDKIHNGYFSIDKKGRFIDSKENRSEGGSDDVSAYDLIMKDKERLLSFEEPTRFIFSHSALREGWDNPNIFQICTLRHTRSDISKRQEIGRGLRICVNNDGERMDASVLGEEFFNINKLTIIANESYEEFAQKLQTEIVENLKDRPIRLTTKVLDGRVFKNKFRYEIKIDEITALDLVTEFKGKGYLDDEYKVSNKFYEEAKSGTINFSKKLKQKLNGCENEIIEFVKQIYETSNFKYKFIKNEKDNNIYERELKPNDNFYKKEFQELWRKINFKTIYEVNFNSEELIKRSIASINKNLKVNRIKVKIVEGFQKEKIDKDDLEKKVAFKKNKEIIQEISSTIGKVKYDLIGEISKETKLTRKTIVKILKGIDKEKFDEFKINPEDFIIKVSKLINQEKATTLINQVIYKITNNKYESDIFTINSFKGKLGDDVLKVKKHIYDYLKIESLVEKRFAENGLETGDIIAVYAKLPRKFVIPTPIGNYNPDWAIVFKNDDRKFIYFIAETKGSMESLQLKEVEKKKIEYAKKHFETLNRYFSEKDDMIKFDVVSTYEDLVNKILK